jgi:hypothetical protein
MQHSNDPFTAIHSGAQPREQPRSVGHERRMTNHVARSAGSAGIPRAEVPAAASAVTDALGRSCSPGRLDHVFKLMPAALTELLTDGKDTRHAS